MAFQFVCKEIQVALLKSEVIPKNSGATFEMKRGQRLRIAGKSIVDFVAFNCTIWLKGSIRRELKPIK